MPLNKINLGTVPNLGQDGDDARTAFTKVNANFDELYAALGGTGGTVSPKVTAIANSVWAANQLLMASGANTLSMLATGANGRALIAGADAAANRSNLGLGTAATGTVTTSTSDNTVGRILRVGDFGIGSIGINVTDADALRVSGIYNLATTAGGGVNGPPQIGTVGWTVLHMASSSNATTPSGWQLASPQTSVSANKGRMFKRQVFSGTWSAWTEVADTDTVATMLGAAGWGANGVTGSNIPASTDLNTMITPGSFGQPLNANATLALNYPINQAGTLLVQAAGVQVITQDYTNYNTGRKWSRSCYVSGGTPQWSAWKEWVAITDFGLGADQAGSAGKYVLLPLTPGNVAPTAFIAARAADDQATTGKPVEGEDFAGAHISRELRPIQIGVSGRGVNAKLYFRGFAGASANLSEWKRAVDEAYMNSFGLGSFSARVTDANAPTVTGMYRLAGTDANVPETTSGCSVWHNQQTATIAAQIAIVTTNGNVWTRTNNNGTWTSWVRSAGIMEVTALMNSFGLGVTLQPAVTDLNALTVSGSYRIGTSGNGHPLPGASGTVEHRADASARMTQTFIATHANTAALRNRMFFRTSTNAAATWDPWVEVSAAGAGGINRMLDLRGSVYVTGTPKDVFNAGTVFGFANGGSAAGGLAIPGLGSTVYGVLRVDGQYLDGTGLGAFSREFTTAGRRWIQYATSATAWGGWVEQAALNGAITGYAVGANTPVAETDSLLAALGKLQGQANATAPVTKGGTGATTAAAARTNLGLGTAAVADILGTVSAGNALQQVISNANGTAYRFANGLQVCVLPRGNNVIAGPVGIGSSGTHAWTFPAAFVNLNYTVTAIFEPTQSVDHFGFTHAGSWATTSCGLTVRNGPAIAQTFVVSAIAVGSWQ